jgi:hypothetical protein
MELYHGSNVAIPEPEIRASSRRLDFGLGFYTTTSFDQAKRWSISKTKLEKSGIATVSIFTVPNDFLQTKGLYVQDFNKADEQWLDFVIANRTDENFSFQYDIVKDPVANDRVFASLNAFESGFMDKPTLLKELRTWVYVDQILFHTEKALKILSYSRAVKV